MTHRTTPENPGPGALPRVAEAAVDRVRSTIIDWFAAAARPLPWREPDTSAWAILVSEIMSQQTPVARVEPRWREWMARWPTPADLAQAPTAEVLRRWDRLGYPRRALRLQEAARVIVAEHGGRVPMTATELETLPGIGAYTAAAVASFAHGERTTVLDTNVRRVLIRLFAGRDRPTPAPSRRETQWAQGFVPLERHREWNAGVMEFGALVCTARGPRCADCPLSDLCAWNRAGRPASATKPTAQKWAGTDRQLRGAIMDVLRAAHTDDASPTSVPVDLFLAPTAEVDLRLLDELGPVTAASLRRMRDLSADAHRVSRLVSDLIADGLAERHEDRLSLPR
ncbi:MULTISPECIES: A/G-specific adenine glycosylase [Brevibacterium]|nr:MULTISPECIES: A/G-specific adenine glycosylase [Brevibacterium]